MSLRATGYTLPVSTHHHIPSERNTLLPVDHDNAIKWNHFPCDWQFLQGIHRSLVNSPHNGQWRGQLMFSLICAWMSVWVNNREADESRRNRAHYDVMVIIPFSVTPARGDRISVARLHASSHPQSKEYSLAIRSLWRHQMEPFSAWLATCTGNSPVTGEFPEQRPVPRSFDVFFDLRRNKRLSKQSWGWWFETPSRSL